MNCFLIEESLETATFSDYFDGVSTTRSLVKKQIKNKMVLDVASSFLFLLVFNQKN